MPLSVDFLGKCQFLFWLTVCAVNTVVCTYPSCLAQNNSEGCIPTSNREELDYEWRSNNCEKISCVRKCCPLNMYVSGEICNTSIYEEMENELRSFGSQVIVNFLQNCGRDKRFLLESTEFVIDNGTLSFAGSITASYDRYCVDWFNHSNNSLAALVCFPEYVEKKYAYAGNVIL